MTGKAAQLRITGASRDFPPMYAGIAGPQPGTSSEIAAVFADRLFSPAKSLGILAHSSSRTTRGVTTCQSPALARSRIALNNGSLACTSRCRTVVSRMMITVRGTHPYGCGRPLSRHGRVRLGLSLVVAVAQVVEATSPSQKRSHESVLADPSTRLSSYSSSDPSSGSDGAM
jgi:hypothetical protein